MKSQGSNTYVDKTHLKIHTAIRDKEKYYILIKGLINEENMTIVKIYVPNMYVCVRSVIQSCPTLCEPMDCTL